MSLKDTWNHRLIPLFSRPNRRRGMGGAAWIVAGLGNPGQAYENTRHNAGFMVVDELARRAGVPMTQIKHRAHVATASIGGQKVLLMKPVTYMNRSGEAIADAAGFLKLAPDHILVICDDAALPLGKLRIRRGGSDGGQKGLQSIQTRLNTAQYPRLRVGVGERPHPDYDMADWVLSRFSGADKAVMKQAAGRAADAVSLLLDEGLEKAMAAYN